MQAHVYRLLFESFDELLGEGKLDQIIFRISGGEPMLAYAIWHPLMTEFMNKHAGKVSAVILTTLAMDIEPYIDDIKKYYSLSTSLDGIQASKPFHSGKSSASTVIKNIQKLLDSGFHNIGVTTVLNDATCKELPQLAEFFANTQLNWSIDVDHYYTKSKILEDILEHSKKAIDILVDSGYDIYRKFRYNNIRLTENYDGCTAGRYLFAVNTDGFVYPCQTAMYGQPLFHVGDKSEKWISNEYLNFECYRCLDETTHARCADCVILPYCHGNCKLNRKDGNNEVCYINKEIFKYLTIKILDNYAKL
jgi:radical SAM protein with 4Fe4S-binding SPASM domain